MNNFFEQLKTKGQNIRLTTNEKDQMRSRIFAVSETGPTASPYAFFSLLFVQRTLVPVLAVLMVFIGAGTAYAAEGALPGSPLYAVKIHINEKLQTTLAVNAQQKAQMHAALAHRRVEEAEALAAMGGLDAATSIALAKNFEEHVSATEIASNELAQTNPEEAEEIKTKFGVSIQAHGKVLAQLSVGHADREERGIVRAVSVLAVSNVRTKNTKTQVLSMAEGALFVEGDNKSVSAEIVEESSMQKRMTKELRERAREVVAKTERQLALLKPSLLLDVATLVGTKVASTSARMDIADHWFNAGEYEAARAEYEAVLRGSIELSTYLDAQQRFEKQNILPQLLRHLDNESEDTN